MTEQAATSGADTSVMREVERLVDEEGGSFDRLHVLRAGEGEFVVRIYPDATDEYEGHIIRV